MPLAFFSIPGAGGFERPSRLLQDRPLKKGPDVLVVAFSSQGVLEVDLAIGQEAGPEMAFRGQAQTVAAVTELVARGADETEFPLPAGDPETPGGPVGGRPFAVQGYQGVNPADFPQYRVIGEISQGAFPRRRFRCS